MTRILSKLIILICIMMPAQVMSQCTPDITIVIPGIYPDSLPVAYVDTPYVTVIDFRTPPPDTTVSGFPATIDSIEIISYTGMPPGFTFACNRASCMYYPNENGCVAIVGTAAAGDFGNWPLTGVLKIYVHVGVIPGNITDTNTALVIQVCTPDTCEGLPNTGIVEQGQISEVNVYPNPFSDNITIDIVAKKSGVATWRVFDMMGRVVHSEVIELRAGRNMMQRTVTDLPPGISLQRVDSQGVGASGVLVKR